MKLSIVETGYFKLDGGAMFGVVPKTIWAKLHPPDENNLCTWSMRCLLIEKDHRRILIDTGLGDKQSDKFFSHYHPHGEDNLENSLKKLGYGYEDITDVILTHLHFDHCGGAVYRDENDELKVRFPNATYWSNRKHWEWARQPNSREKASFLKENFIPIEESGQLKFADENTKIIDEISIFLAKGHTECQIIPHIEYKGKTVVYCADLLPSVHHIPLPYVMAYDVRPLETLKEKAAFLKRAHDKGWVLFFEHDPDNQCCSLRINDKGRIAAGEVFDLSTLG
jgi:glyoxylase-like metal-dependent hydrolase (beta-lactamase superfamily II)